MTTILGRLFGLYAIYRAWIGRPIPGRRRSRRLALVAFEWPPRETGTITAQHISANATTANYLTTGVIGSPIQFSGTGGNFRG